jgi:GntR family transcriptional regulator, phosphonate transport system regulatory protein
MSLYAVSRDNGESLYIQIARQLEQEVATGYGPGDCLPAEGLLAVRFGVNRHTLRRAIDELVEAGLLERRHGRGVFVLDILPPSGCNRRTAFCVSRHWLQPSVSHNAWRST